MKLAQLAPSHSTAIPSVLPTSEFTAILTINSETQLQAELRGYFREVLKPSGQNETQRCRRIELCCTGEVLTSDEVLERIEQADVQKDVEKAAKKTEKWTKSSKSNKIGGSTTIVTEEQDTEEQDIEEQDTEEQDTEEQDTEEQDTEEQDTEE